MPRKSRQTMLARASPSLTNTEPMLAPMFKPGHSTKQISGSRPDSSDPPRTPASTSIRGATIIPPAVDHWYSNESSSESNDFGGTNTTPNRSSSIPAYDPSFQLRTFEPLQKSQAIRTAAATQPTSTIGTIQYRFQAKADLE
ncbi:hypothetical protein CC78DRAFT_588388 [Lojkania enalia]|uniref:Uncharacterized protein n=1 Tax=Lojkania enalia TaxID=147567 RepID=A0A9P4N0D6_9PLEO|nr:hypothetical protein CC78DRAFT_588388 [Didymosphaeria enalia]